MNDESHARPEGRSRPEALGAEGLDDDGPDEWDRMIAAFRTAAPRGSAPPWLEQRVMAEIASLPEPNAWRRALDWLVRPASVRISPLTAGLAAAALAAALLFPDDRASPPPSSDRGGLVAANGAQTEIYVQFVLEAPTATSVAVAGDFSDWEPSFTLTDSDGDGVWTGRIPIRPGVHGYMYLIDETIWQTDPNAERYQDDGFGNRNAVLAVGASS
jgi:hypothetical protein